MYALLNLTTAVAAVHTTLNNIDISQRHIVSQGAQMAGAMSGFPTMPGLVKP